MKNYDSSHIKNIALAGHSASGKTSVAEALLYKAGATDRLGKTLDGNTVSDYTPIEIAKKCSIYTSLSFYERNGMKVNILDTPGLFDYASGLVEGVFAADCLLITVSAKSGIHVGTKKAYDAAVAHKTPHMFVVTKIDDENANFSNVLTDLKTQFGSSVCPLVAPIIKDSKIVSYYDLLAGKNYKYDAKGNRVDAGEPDPTYRLDGLMEAISEAVAETDEELMMKFLDGEELTHEELVNGVHNGIVNGTITPVTCISSVDLAGADLLMDQIEKLLPSPHETAGIVGKDRDGNEVKVTLETAKLLTQRSNMRYDRAGDEHYDILSALQKSIRGSDENAALHYAARLIESGDIISLCRRLLVIAAEDIGLAYPQAIPIVKACVDSALQLGLPEAKIPLADAVVLLATAPKSNSGNEAIIAALKDLKNHGGAGFPRHLQNVHLDGEGAAVKGQHYLYPHDFPNHWVEQQYLPDEIKDHVYYIYGENKTEQAAKAYWDAIKKKK